MITKIYEWRKTWEMEFNVKKKEVMYWMWERVQ